MQMFEYLASQNKEESDNNGLIDAIKRRISGTSDDKENKILESKDDFKREINEKLLNKFVDPNIANNCLKLLVLILSSQ